MMSGTEGRARKLSSSRRSQLENHFHPNHAEPDTAMGVTVEHCCSPGVDQSAAGAGELDPRSLNGELEASA
jgi:hypothetical protein